MQPNRKPFAFQIPIPITMPNSNQVSPSAADQMKYTHSHKGSQVDVSNLTKLIKQSKQSTAESMNSPTSTQQIQLLLAKAKEITGQFKHVRKDSNTLASLKDLLKKDVQKALFHIEFVIGIGGFGKVWKVEHKKTNQHYAMKEMNKALVITKKSVNSVMNERTLLSQLKHQFVVNMHFAFQDRENLFLVMDYMKGGDLRFHIGKHRRFSEEQTRFFVACIFMGLEYIHAQNIIHRDIKPENLVLDESGFVRITDFGIARIMKLENSQDTSGTPGYMAPEVMYRQNHTFAVDYFALGVIAYEFMVGRRPYIGRTRQEIRDQIIAKQVQVRKSDIPEGWSLEAADFINKMILRKPQTRLGFNGSHEIRQHPWFNNFPWDRLASLDLVPPFIPNKTEDNFDQKQIILEDEENSELIQQNSMLLRDHSVQDMFLGYEFNCGEQSSFKK